MSADTNLLSAVTHEDSPHTDGFRVVKISGDPAAGAIAQAVIGNYAHFTGRPRPTEEELLDLIGEKVTLIQHGENMLGATLVNALEGKLFAGSRGLGVLPKGARTKGFVVKPNRQLDVLRGYSTAEAKELVDSCVARLPRLRNLTQERLNELPQESSTCTMALLGQNRLWEAPDCIWLLAEYQKEDDIVDNVMLIRPEYAFSEHGSCLGRELLSNRALGEVVDFEPISYAGALELCNVPFDEALARIAGAGVC